MGILIYNEKAVWAVILGVFGGFGMASFSRNAALSAMTGAGIAVAIDLYGRMTNGEESQPLLHPDAGGHVWFIPIWIVGLIALGIGGVSWLGWV
jgi:hypothetical protein